MTEGMTAVVTEMEKEKVTARAVVTLAVLASTVVTAVASVAVVSG